MKTVLAPRAGMFDNRLNEPGPHELVTNDGIVLIYNGMNLPKDDPDRDRNLIQEDRGQLWKERGIARSGCPV